MGNQRIDWGEALNLGLNDMILLAERARTTNSVALRTYRMRLLCGQRNLGLGSLSVAAAKGVTWN